jgi:catechol 2,3-dioxygenase-like lactoylglutathione lyase family enzyme
MKIVSVASFALVTQNQAANKELFIGALGLPLNRHEGDEYYFTEEFPGSNHFGLWPLSQAAEACFGTSEWPAELTTPQACVEFEVAELDLVAEAGKELEGRGYSVLHPARTEPWGQTIVRVLTDEGVIVGVSHAPWQHTAAAPDTAPA